MEKKNEFVCENCACAFKSEIDLDAHLFNNKHCAPISKCPECLKPTPKEELDVFGGLCENCATDAY